MEQPHNGWAEQNPLHWKDAAILTIREVVAKSMVHPENVAGVGLSGQMHRLVMLNEENRLIDNAIIWCDQRSSKEAEEMQNILPMEKWIHISANPPLAGWTAVKFYG